MTITFEIDTRELINLVITILALSAIRKREPGGRTPGRHQLIVEATSAGSRALGYPVPPFILAQIPPGINAAPGAPHFPGADTHNPYFLRFSSAFSRKHRCRSTPQTFAIATTS